MNIKELIIFIAIIMPWTIVIPCLVYLYTRLKNKIK